MKIKKSKRLFFSVVLFFLGFLALVFAIWVNHSLVIKTMEIPAVLEVGKVSGFNLDNSTFSFGTITPGTTSSRMFQIENNYSFPIVAKISSKGNISRFLIFENKVKLPSQEKKIIPIATIYPMEEDYGNYSGEIIVILKREI